MTNVTLRQRKIGKGRISLYLDYYPPLFNPITRETHRHESLHTFIYENPQDETERDFNKEMLKVAEAVRCQRAVEILKGEFNIFDERKLNADFLEYFRNSAKGKHTKWYACYLFFERFTNGKCRFADLSVDLCKKFKDYLLNEAIKRRDGFRICNNTASAYYCLFRACLAQAYKERYLKENLNDYLDKIPVTKTHKEFLTMEEAKMLKNTPCDIDVLKRASIFSILTGFRISDIMSLQWEHISIAPDGGPCVRKKIQKSNRWETIYISEEALSYCGYRYETGPVFYGLQRNMIYKPLERWIKAAGITKHITFHCFRHTFATLQLANGTDIYTVSHQLAHQNVQTTQIYADLVDEKRRASANALTLDDK